LIEHTQVHCFNRDFGNGRRRLLLHHRLQVRDGDRSSFGLPLPQRRLHGRLAFLGRQLQDL
jgi:hypothetical protein